MTKKELRLNVRIEEDMAKKLAKILEKYHTTISDLIRKSLEKVIEAEFG